jgi:hypothetical protein
MIEINLLPAEFRPREKTNLPLMVTVAAGMLVVGGIILFGIRKNSELATLKTELERKQNKLDRLNERVKAVNDLENRIAAARARQDTIIEISQSKVMWSLKLQQFSQIMGDYPTFWIDQMTLTKSRTKPSLKVQCSSTGSSLRDVARFREALKSDPNFFYHFSDLESGEVRIQPLPKGWNYSERMDFSMTLPLKKRPVGKKKKR